MEDGVARVEATAALNLAILLTSRVSHDLSGVVGGLAAAIGEADEDADALLLAKEAALVLRQRLALFRAAWGGAPPALDRARLRDLVRGLPNASRFQLELDALEDRPPFAPAAARVVLSTILLAGESLPGGGVLAVAGDPGSRVVVTIAGPKACWPPELGTMLANPAAAWEAVGGLSAPSGLRLLPATLLALLAPLAGVRAGLLLAVPEETVPPLLLEFSAVGCA